MPSRDTRHGKAIPTTETNSQKSMSTEDKDCPNSNGRENRRQNWLPPYGCMAAAIGTLAIVLVAPPSFLLILGIGVGCYFLCRWLIG